MLRRVLLAGSICALTGPAFAGDVPLYQPAPGWVEVADLARVSNQGKGALVLYDVQEMVEGDRLTVYVDSAARIETPENLTQMGTLAALWIPDKGDLLVHRAELFRDGQTIDLLKDRKFEVLRREQQLEQRALNGLLTAAMPVAGARVGDVIRLAYSVTTADSALGGHVQRIDLLPAVALRPGLGRLRVTWPRSRTIQFMTRPGLPAPTVEAVGNWNRVEMALPIPKPTEMPGDAPVRFRLPPQLNYTSFASWNELSRIMAPLFSTEGTIAKGSPIALEVEKIRAAGGSQRVQATAALKIVQERISYFLNGMNGGNYVPQSPMLTWESRYGDCKAKTLLLLAMLRELGIAADPLLVNSVGGDAVEQSLPMAAAFDHVVVRADIDGQSLLLDGTSAGAAVETLGDGPNFAFGLPLRVAGSGLVAVAPRLPAAADMVVKAEFNQGFGIDLPELFKTRIEFSGPIAALWRGFAATPEGKERDQALDRAVNSALGNVQVTARRIEFDNARGKVSIVAEGLRQTNWDTSQRRATIAPPLGSSSINFAPDRGRAAWQAIPLAIGNPNRVRFEHSYTLPAPGSEFEMVGPTFHGDVAGTRIDRDSRIEGNMLHIREEMASAGGEIAPGAFAAERANFERFRNAALRLRAKGDLKRRWEVRTAADRAALRPILDAYSKLVAAEPDAASPYVNRANFQYDIGDLAASLRDYDKALTLDASAETYALRARTVFEMGNYQAAIAGLTKAYELEPNAERLSELALVLGKAGKADEALGKVDAVIDSAGEGRTMLRQIRAELLARLGRKDEGLAELDRLSDDRPGDEEVLNARCWYRGAWNYAIEGAVADCNGAVESSDFSPPFLDSRAVAFLRLGELDKALADAEAALARAGWQTQTLLLRGVIRQRKGDPAGAGDIAEALRRNPGLRQEYVGYGLLP